MLGYAALSSGELDATLWVGKHANIAKHDDWTVPLKD